MPLDPGPHVFRGTRRRRDSRRWHAGLPIETQVIRGSRPQASHQGSRSRAAGQAASTTIPAQRRSRESPRRSAAASHVHPHLARPRPRGPHLERENSAARLDLTSRPAHTAGHNRWATQRTPLPHISASEPSALNIRIRASARARTADEDQPVAADAPMPVGDPPAPGRPGRRASARRSSRRRRSRCRRRAFSRSSSSYHSRDLPGKRPGQAGFPAQSTRSPPFIGAAPPGMQTADRAAAGPGATGPPLRVWERPR